MNKENYFEIYSTKPMFILFCNGWISINRLGHGYLKTSTKYLKQRFSG